MTDSTSGQEVSNNEFESVNEVPVQVVNTYARLWQFETWLRTLVYVELRALLGDNWCQDLNVNPGSLKSDKAQTHMPTPEMNALSYAQLSKLLELIEKYWDCFSAYLPPQPLWDAKTQEVSQIRHRVAHFRIGHRDDLSRVKQLLRDLDRGFWKFCTSYNAYRPVLPPMSDAVSRHFFSLDPLPWCEIASGEWAQVGMRDKTLPVGVSVRAQRRPWATSTLLPGAAGHFYDFRLFAQDGRSFDLGRLLDRTQASQARAVHVCLEDENSVRLTIPSIIGAPAIVELVENFHDAALATALRGSRTFMSPDDLADAWPEYVIGPRNPLSFLDPEMPCSFFGV